MNEDVYRVSVVKKYISLKSDYIKLRNSLISDFETKFPDEVNREMQNFRERTDKIIERLDKFHTASIDLSGGMYDAGDRVNNLLTMALDGLSYVQKKLAGTNPRHIPDGRETAKEEPVEMLVEHICCADNSLKYLANYAMNLEENHPVPPQKYRH